MGVSAAFVCGFLSVRVIHYTADTLYKMVVVLKEGKIHFLYVRSTESFSKQQKKLF